MERIFTEQRHHGAEVRYEHLKHLINKPIEVLEIGVWEGESTCWLLDNICTHPDAKVSTVDPFFYEDLARTSEEKEEFDMFASGNFNHKPDIIERYRNNLGEQGRKVTHYYETSDQFFARLTMCGSTTKVDVAIVDGAHNAFQASRDLLNCWSVLRNEGIMIADDYGWTGHKMPGFTEWESNGPHRAIDAFMSIVPARDYEILHLDYIAIFKKRF